MSTDFNIECRDCGAKTEWHDANWYDEYARELINSPKFGEMVLAIRDFMKVGAGEWSVKFQHDWMNGLPVDASTFIKCVEEKHRLGIRDEYGYWHHTHKRGREDEKPY